MKYIKYLIIIGLIALIGLSAFNYIKTEEVTVKPKIMRHAPLKEVEIFDIENDQIELIISKSASSSADVTANISPQISGKVTDINVKVGDYVSANDLLIKLGQSLSTDNIDTQYASANSSLKIARESENATAASTEISINTSELAARNAIVSFNRALETKETTQDMLQLQIDGAELNVDNLEESIEDLEDQIDNLEDALQIEQLETAIKTAETQLDQANLAVDQAQKNYELQIQQLEAGIAAAKIQCEISLRQVESAKVGAILQQLQAQGQVLQADTSKTIAELQYNQKNIKSPIDGVITSITIEEGNLVSPGQVLIKVEKTDKVKVRASLNEKEVQFVAVGDEVSIEIEEELISGKIASISPSLNSQSKKIDVEIETTDAAIIPGSFAKIHFKAHSKGKIFVPLNSIYLNEGKKFVWVLSEKNETSLKEIKSGEIIGDYIEVKSGLSGKEKIIHTSSSFLSEGEKVKIADK